MVWRKKKKEEVPEIEQEEDLEDFPNDNEDKENELMEKVNSLTQQIEDLKQTQNEKVPEIKPKQIKTTEQVPIRVPVYITESDFQRYVIEELRYIRYLIESEVSE